MKDEREHCVSALKKLLKPNRVVGIDMKFIDSYTAKGIAEELGIEVIPNYKNQAWEFSYGICSE